MKYRLKKGVVLFPMCGDLFIVPSRKAGFKAPMIITVSSELALVLSSQQDLTKGDVSEATINKIQNLKAVGLLEEC